MPLCFAYGSNMDRAAMALRCPGSKPVGVARLPRHRFVIMPEGYASVVRDPARDVWGVLWDVALADVRTLDAYEEVGRGLYGKIIQPVVKAAGGSARALVYVGRSGAGGRPKPGYLEGVLAAARDWGLPERYIREIEGLSPRRPAAGALADRQGLGKPEAGAQTPGGVAKVRPRFATPFDRRD